MARLQEPDTTFNEHPAISESKKELRQIIKTLKLERNQERVENAQRIAHLRAEFAKQREASEGMALHIRLLENDIKQQSDQFEAKFVTQEKRNFEL